MGQNIDENSFPILLINRGALRINGERIKHITRRPTQFLFLSQARKPNQEFRDRFGLSAAEGPPQPLLVQGV